MVSSNVCERIKEAVIAGNPESVEILVKEALRVGLDPISVLKEGLVAGVKTVGAKFESGELFLADLIMAGDAMTTGSELLRGAIEEKTQGKGVESVGKVVMATVKDDIHDIGKNIVVTLLKVEGFEVTDLGKDVPIDAIIKKVDERKADILGLSALLTTTMVRQKEAVETLTRARVRDSVRVIIGGAPTHEGWAREIGADAWAPDAIEAVKKCRELVERE
jgi:5-methyltetrahydrofolate--homocysteine methyltransferase